MLFGVVHVETVLREVVVVFFVVPHIQAFLMPELAEGVLLAADVLDDGASHVQEGILHDLEDSSAGTGVGVDLFDLPEGVLQDGSVDFVGEELPCFEMLLR